MTVHCPEEMVAVPIHPAQLAEWKYTGALFAYAGPGAEIETAWCGGGYDQLPQPTPFGQNWRREKDSCRRC